jgi:hypothetical protein
MQGCVKHHGDEIEGDGEPLWKTIGTLRGLSLDQKLTPTTETFTKKRYNNSMYKKRYSSSGRQGRGLKKPLDPAPTWLFDSFAAASTKSRQR